MRDPIVPPPLPPGLPREADPSRFDAVLARARRRLRLRVTAAVAATGTAAAVVALGTASHPASLHVRPADPAAPTAIGVATPTPSPTPTPASPAPTPTVSPTPERTAVPPTPPTERTPDPTEEPGASPTATPSPTASEYGPHRAWRHYVAGTAPATCTSNQVRQDADPQDRPDNDWCMVYLGPDRVRIGDEFTIVIRICRSDAAGVQAKEMVSHLVPAVRHEAHQSTWLQHVLPEDRPIEVQPGDCLEWTVTGWEKRIPLEPGTYVVDASNHDWDVCRYCYFYDPAAKWDVIVTK